ncbi:23S rRNA (cytidine(2498)-2'-O)-methyltransferase RlmM [Halotalea alkalilenta]|uniref:23S rRNA (cytidine(2498)-2'-O)-methyltransferase RlmM n=1 Tax=Halotalea alkalilenta TaxID=376489 RepID=UPI0005B7838C|nr:23S rRNA (cytidine(2498)-2'-O)-methyltransferase RlmM [Halotalea alkalilenta]
MQDQVSPLVANEWLLYCRPGFESDLAAELADRLGEAPLRYAAEPGAGYVRAISIDGSPVNPLQRSLPLEATVFARQSLVALPPLEMLSRDDRISPIVAQVVASGWSFESLTFEAPDTNDGKALAGLGKALARPLESLFRKRGALRRSAGARRLHLFWTAGDRVQLGLSFPGNRSEYPGGILRLKFPPHAPSRSTLKLEEAWHQFLPRSRWEEALAPGSTAADLGAAPGGWTWQLVQRGMQVYAIDNGPMDKALMRTGMVEHLREDGFKWSPPGTLDWLVCDIVDRPSRVIEMVSRWLTQRWCRFSVFNLKLPMNRRWQEVDACLGRLRDQLDSAGIDYRLHCRHLYHDREEVTVFVELR